MNAADGSRLVAGTDYRCFSQQTLQWVGITNRLWLVDSKIQVIDTSTKVRGPISHTVL